MNVPDKIYIEQKAIMYDMVNTEPCKPDDYEYIRKDALLEWTKVQAAITEKLNGRGAMLKAWDCLIEKIESL